MRKARTALSRFTNPRAVGTSTAVLSIFMRNQKLRDANNEALKASRDPAAIKAAFSPMAIRPYLDETFGWRWCAIGFTGVGESNEIPQHCDKRFATGHDVSHAS